MSAEAPSDPNMISYNTKIKKEGENHELKELNRACQKSPDVPKSSLSAKQICRIRNWKFNHVSH